MAFLSFSMISLDSVQKAAQLRQRMRKSEKETEQEQI
jgi:hypothetical protein